MKRYRTEKYRPGKYRPKRKFKKRKSIFKSRLFWDFVLFSILIFLIFYFFFLSEIFKIKEIKVSSSETSFKKEIETLLEKELGHNFFLVNSQEIENEILEKYPEIKSTHLKKKFPDSLILEIEERKPVGFFCSEKESEEEKENCFLIDNEGIIFKNVVFGGQISEDNQKDLMMIFSALGELEGKNLGKEVISKEKIDKLLKINSELEKSLKINVEEFVLKGEGRLDIKTAEGWEIYFDLSGDVNFALTKLGLLLAKEIPPEKRGELSYIDLRFSKVYYK